MTSNEIVKIERDLALCLPTHYKDFILGFEGLKNTEESINHFIYAKPEELIEINRTIGFYTLQKTVKQKFIIGENGGGDLYLIDLNNTNDKKVYVFDHEEFNGQWADLEHYPTIQDFYLALLEMFARDEENP